MIPEAQPEMPEHERIPSRRLVSWWAGCGLDWMDLEEDSCGWVTVLDTVLTSRVARGTKLELAKLGLWERSVGTFWLEKREERHKPVVVPIWPGRHPLPLHKDCLRRLKAGCWASMQRGGDSQLSRIHNCAVSTPLSTAAVRDTWSAVTLAKPGRCSAESIIPL